MIIPFDMKLYTIALSNGNTLHFVSNELNSGKYQTVQNIINKTDFDNEKNIIIDLTNRIQKELHITILFLQVENVFRKRI